MKVIKIKLNPDEYFKDILNILQGVPPFNSVRKKDLEIYAELLINNARLVEDGLEEDERYKVLFGYRMRRQIQTTLQIGDGSYRNGLYNLRKSR